MHKFVVARLLAVPRPYSSQKAYWKAVADKTGMSDRTIEKIARGEIEDPGITGIELLADHFGYTPRKAAALARRQTRQPARETA